MFEDILHRSGAMILGYGVTGRSVAAFFQRRKIPFSVHDQSAITADFPVQSTFSPTGGEIVMVSPGCYRSEWVSTAKKLGCHCMGDLELAQDFLSNPTVAVTGTNGKTSSLMMLAAIFRAAGIPFQLTGNVGRPIMDAIDAFRQRPNMWNLCEVSSFQTVGLQQFSPAHVLWTNFATNHGDVHPSQEDYFLAKWSLLVRSRGAAFVGEGIVAMADRCRLTLPQNAIVPPQYCGPLPAALEHRRKNFTLVRELCRTIGIDDWAVRCGIRNFQHPPHRLAICSQIGSVEIWNDSKATTAHAALDAIQYLRSRVQHILWITGGSSKGENVENFRPIMDGADEVLCFGEMGHAIFNHFFNGRMVHCLEKEEIFQHIEAYVRQRVNGFPAAVLFSPGFASFDLFANYGERGHWFLCGISTLVQKLFK